MNEYEYRELLEKWLSQRIFVSDDERAFTRRVLEKVFPLETTPTRLEDVSKGISKALMQRALLLSTKLANEQAAEKKAAKRSAAAEPKAPVLPPVVLGPPRKEGTRAERIADHMKREAEKQREKDEAILRLLESADEKKDLAPTEPRPAAPPPAEVSPPSAEQREELFARHGSTAKSVEALLKFYEEADELDQKALWRILVRLDNGEPLQNFSGIIKKMERVDGIYEIRPRKATSGTRVFFEFRQGRFVLLVAGQAKGTAGEQDRLVDRAVQQSKKGD